MSADYHQTTAYTRSSLGGHGLDWANQPWPFKRYDGLEPAPLAEPEPNQAPFWELALGWPPRHWAQAATLDAAGLASILWLAAGLTARSGSGLYLRAQASAGALYPNELYLCAQGMDFLDDGLYHFAPQANGLTLLRRGALADVVGKCLGQGPRGLSFIITSIFWRSAWKYRSRAWRYCLLDAGHVLANLELALAAQGLEQTDRLNLASRAMAGLLGIDTNKETPLIGVLAGQEIAGTDQQAPADLGLIPELPLSAREPGDPVILQASRVGALAVAAPDPAWPPKEPPAGARDMAPSRPQDGPALARVVAARRSRRNFIRQGLGLEQIALLLAAAMPAPGALGARVLLGPGPGVEAGGYQYHPGGPALEQVQDRDLRAELARACLGQLWVGQAAMSLVLYADLAALERRAGAAAYRHAMIQAGRVGQRLYLAATALGLGCCGVGAFFDQEAAAAAHLPETASPLYVLSCGPVKGGTA